MELTQYHTLLPVKPAKVLAALQAKIRPVWLHKRAMLSAAILGPWRPCDVWPGTPEVLLWTVGFIGNGALLNTRGEEKLREGSIERRHMAVTPAELVAMRLGQGLAVRFSDAETYAYVALYRERHLRYSQLYQDRTRLVRSDGEVVVVEEPPGPESGRIDTLLTGFQRLLAAPFHPTDDACLFLPDTLEQLLLDRPTTPLIDYGEWVTPEPDENVDGPELM